MQDAETFIRRPELAFRVGVTGARALDAAAVDGLRERVDAVLAFVKTWMEQAAAAAVYAPGPPLLRLISPLAEGADRLVAGQALALGYRLEAPLPFSIAEYEQDFPDSVTAFRALIAAAGPRVLELDGARGDAESESYEAAGRLVARNCDLLIAIWDGGRGRGKGGTAEIVRYAVRHGQAVWWLPADGAGEPGWIETMQEWKQPALAVRGKDALARLEAYLAGSILPAPEIHEPAHGIIGSLLHRLRRHPPASPLTDLLAEQPLKPRAIWTIHRRLMRWAAGTPAAVTAEAAPVPPDSEVWRYWQLHYEPLDQSAIGYGDRYRSSYILVFAIAALAVCCAVLGVGFHLIARFATTAEFLCLAGILLIVAENEFRRWHPRLIAYRLLAELFRKQQALAMLAWSLPAAEAVNISGEAGAAPAPRDALVGWYFNAALRAAPLPSGQLAGQALREIYRAVTTSLVAGQASYHAKRRREAEAAAHRFGRLGAESFLLTLLLVFGKFILLWAQYIWPPAHSDGTLEHWITAAGFVAVILPALSAAFVGIRGYAELELLADQSVQMQRLTEQADSRLRKLQLDAPLASQELGAEILRLAEGMLRDVKGWAQLFRVKAVETG
jgi:hypothetical protein